jgi:hypothetical protein
MRESFPTTTSLIARAELSSDQLAAMFELLTAHFEGVTREQFERDISEKNWAMLIERGGRLVGFTTILAYETKFGRDTVSVIYSGDTIVSPEAWNSSALPRGWIESVVKLRALYPRGWFYWLLITSGFRTYRLLPVFWQDFSPRYDEETGPLDKALLDHLAYQRFGDRYDLGRGIVRLAQPQRLRGVLAEVPAGRLDDPHVTYFLSRNPAHARGDELVCITELSPANLTAAGKRMAKAVPAW